MICNPTAAAGTASHRLPVLARRVRRRVAGTEVVTTQRRGEAVRLAREAASGGADLVIAAGGDGTVNEVVNGLLRAGSAPPALLHLPVGTGCDFGRSLGLAHTAEQLASHVDTSQVRWIDVGRLDLGRDDGPRWFVNGVNVGLGAGILRRLQGSSWLRHAGRYGYLLAAGLEFWQARPLDLALRIEHGPERRMPLINLSLCNGRYFGGGMQVPGNPQLDNGRLVVVRVGAMHRFAGLRQLRRAMAGRVEHAAIHSESVAGISVAGARAGFEVDGELETGSKFHASVRKRALRVLIPIPN